MSCSTRNLTRKFFASENGCYQNICRNSHSDQTHNSFNNYKLDDCTQGMDTQVYIALATEGSKGVELLLTLMCLCLIGIKMKGLLSRGI